MHFSASLRSGYTVCARISVGTRLLETLTEFVRLEVHQSSGMLRRKSSPYEEILRFVYLRNPSKQATDGDKISGAELFGYRE